MGLEAFGHTLSDICEGVSEIRKGRSKSLPLKDTRFEIDVQNGLAKVKTVRTFENDKDKSIEALMTFPVPFDAILTSLTADIDGRRLVSVAKSKNNSRETYEEAVDQGKMAILHEEPLRGIHMLSIGQLGAKKKVSIETEMVMALADHTGIPFLRIPLTVAEIYGTSPLLPSDSLLTESGLKMSGILNITERSGQAVFTNGSKVDSGNKIPLNKSLEILFPEQKFGSVKGFDAWGRPVLISLKQPGSSDKNIDVAIMLDRSGSTNEMVGRNGKTIRHVIEDAVRNAIQQFNDKDRISIWEFDDDARLIAEGYVSEIRKNVVKFTDIANGTEIGRSIDTVIRHRPSAVIVLTDGQTYAAEAQTLAKLGYPISAVLVGPGSLDAMIGHLAASTGGQVFAAAEDDAKSAFLNAVKGFRKGTQQFQGNSNSGKPIRISTFRSGTEVEIIWDEKESSDQCDSIGRYAMALAMPLFDEKNAEELAALHGLVTHLTSLVIVDEIGEKSINLPQTIKIPLSSVAASYQSRSYSMLSMNMEYVEKIQSKRMISDLSAEIFDAENSMQENFDYYIELVEEYLKSKSISFNWDSISFDIHSGISDWPVELLAFFAQLDQDQQIQELLSETNISVYNLILLYFAKRDEKKNRNAARIYRKIIAEIEPSLRDLIDDSFD